MRFLLMLAVMLAAPSVRAAHPTDAQDLSTASLEELTKIEIYSASKFLQPVAEAPSFVTIVTAEEIARQGYRTLSEVLASIGSLYINYDRNYSYIGVRGFSRPGDYNTGILLLIDGHRMNDNIYDGACIGTEFPLDVDLIERVEVIRGPGASLYGTNALFAVVNIITRTGTHLSGLELSASAGTFGSYLGRATYGRAIRDGDLLASASWYSSSGPEDLYYPEYDSPDTNRGIAHNVDDDAFGQAFLNIHWRKFKAQALHGRREKTIPTGAFETIFNDPRSRTVDARSYFDLQYENTIARAFTLQARAFVDRYRYDADYALQTEEGNAYINRDYVVGSWWGSELKINTEALRRQRLTAGFEFRHNFRLDQLNFDLDPFSVWTDDRRTSFVWAVYGQDEIRLHRRVTLNAGLRYDHYGTFGGTTNPRVGLILRPAEHTTLKVLHGSAFRAPNAYELYYWTSIFRPQAVLHPETIRSTEIVVEQALGGSVQLTASLFHNSQDDLISQLTDAEGDIYFANAGTVGAIGGEVQIESRFAHDIHARLGYTWQDIDDHLTDGSLVNAPPHVAKATVSAPLWTRKLILGANGQFVSRRLTLNGNSLGSYVVVNTNLLARLNSRLDLSLAAYNLFDKRYATSGGEEHRQSGILQDGRTLRCKLTFHLSRN